MTQLNRAAIESAAKGDLDRKELYLAFLQNIEMLCATTGTNILAKTNSPQAPIQPPPAQGALSVSGANGSFTIQIVNAARSLNTTIYNEVSYSASSNFSTGATLLPVSAATHLSLQLPGTAVYWRLRSSFDQANWNNYSYGGLVNSGLQSSAANSAAISLNITNYATVDADPANPTNVRVYGPAGPLTMWVGVKGTKQTVYPSATIVNVSAGTKPLVGWDGEQFLVKKTLPEVFADEIVPVGQVGVPAGGSVTLPTIMPVISGGNIVGYNVTAGGSNIGAPLSIAVAGDGTGATAGPQTIVGGVLISVAAGNLGTAYTHATATPSGGAAPGSSGGGTIDGNNGGRLTALQG